MPNPKYVFYAKPYEHMNEQYYCKTFLNYCTDLKMIETLRSILLIKYVTFTLQKTSRNLKSVLVLCHVTDM